MDIALIGSSAGPPRADALARQCAKNTATRIIQQQPLHNRVMEQQQQHHNHPAAQGAAHLLEFSLSLSRCTHQHQDHHNHHLRRQHRRHQYHYGPRLDTAMVNPSLFSLSIFTSDSRAKEEDPERDGDSDNNNCQHPLSACPPRAGTMYYRRL